MKIIEILRTPLFQLIDIVFYFHLKNYQYQIYIYTLTKQKDLTKTSNQKAEKQL